MRGYVGEVVISCGAEVIARHRRSYERDDFCVRPGALPAAAGAQDGALDQAARLPGGSCRRSSAC